MFWFWKKSRANSIWYILAQPVTTFIFSIRINICVPFFVYSSFNWYFTLGMLSFFFFSPRKCRCFFFYKALVEDEALAIENCLSKILSCLDNSIRCDATLTQRRQQLSKGALPQWPMAAAGLVSKIIRRLDWELGKGTKAAFQSQEQPFSPWCP